MLELWGGHECTVNRVGDRFFDQTLRSGHQHRADDLDRFAELGLKALRYPVLWERVAPSRGAPADWRWTDQRLHRLRDLGIRPIVGLLHHGSGPAYTHLLDPGFPELFAEYARAAAERYPWIEDWTPINEPLTTARFSALYGHWYPHRSDEGAFWTALVNQIDGVRLAMAQVRAVNPAARLVQTEDLGRTYGTRAAGLQTAFDNARRWMTWDLLCGSVSPDHYLWGRLEAFGLGDRLRALSDAPCPPDMLGLNHYLTSDRFLDHRAETYPPERRGGNAFMSYADVEAVRVATPAPGGLEGALEEAWARYGLPLAVTESHNGCTREEQVRWLREAWETAQRLRQRGVDVRAVTAWALLGSLDWASLLTREDGFYEVGAFDLRGPRPRPTAVAAEIRRLAGGAAEIHPATQGPGWWRRDVRLEFKPVSRLVEAAEPRREWRLSAGGPPLLITGATGTLGQALAHACEARGIAYRLTSRRDLTFDDVASIARCVDASGAWGVVNAAGFVRVDDAERQRDACFGANAEGAVRLAEACAERGLHFVSFSSDLVFDGRAERPYLESDAPSPLSVYGASKAEAERGILASGGRALIVRTSAFFSPHDAFNFAAHLMRTLSSGAPFPAASDLVVSPTYVPDLVEATLDLLIDGEVGLRHLSNAGEISWADFAHRLADALALPRELVQPTTHAELAWPAPRPRYAPLGTERGQVLPSLDSAIARFAAHAREFFAPQDPMEAVGAARAR